MDTELVYLRHDALIEPLYNQWYAWTYLLAPQTAPMFVANQHIKLMQSFVASPQVHATAARNPAMKGGAFLDIDPARVSEVKELCERTIKAQPQMFEFAEAVKALDKILAEEGKGFSLEGLYAKVPAALKGYVELVYDLRDNASIRFLEGLLYESRYYDRSAQSLCISTSKPDSRAFRLTTPRLLEPGDLHVHVPFFTRELDEIYRARYTPMPFGRACEALRVSGGEAERLRTFFTTEAPARKPGPAYAGDKPRIRYLGHASVLVEHKGTSMLFDPAVSYDWGDASKNRFTITDLPETIDYAFVTHNHQDHVLIEALLELRHRIKTLVLPRSAGSTLADPSLKLILREIGYPDVREIDDMETISVPGGHVRALPFFGEHGDLDVRTKNAYAVRLEGRQVLLLADSNNVDPNLYERIHERIGDAEIVFLGMECEGAPVSWLYGPLFNRTLVRKNDQSRKFDGCNFDRAVRLVDRFSPKQTYIYAMGQEPWLGHVMGLVFTDTSYATIEAKKLVDQCNARGITSERLHITKELFL